jgi:hypothetical protein
MLQEQHEKRAHEPELWKDGRDERNERTFAEVFIAKRQIDLAMTMCGILRRRIRFLEIIWGGEWRPF